MHGPLNVKNESLYHYLVSLFQQPYGNRPVLDRGILFYMTDVSSHFLSAC